jgi:hypothetical protein
MPDPQALDTGGVYYILGEISGQLKGIAQGQLSMAASIENLNTRVQALEGESLARLAADKTGDRFTGRTAAIIAFVVSTAMGAAGIAFQYLS